MRAAIVLVFATVALAGCVRHRPRETESADSSGAELREDPISEDAKFNGVWVGGTENEPSERELVFEPQCNYTPAVWILEQRGDTVESMHVPEQYAQGVASPPIARPIAARGILSRGMLSFRDGADTYILRYDSASGHLRGTRNGQPFWAVRQQIRHRSDCIPPP